ncbi:MAG: nucleotidyltransferase family protein [Alphaproteobacteria bacterium]
MATAAIDTAITVEQGRAAWARMANVAGGETASTPAIASSVVARLSALASPILTDTLLGGSDVDPETLNQSRLNNRFRLSAQRDCLRLIAAAGVQIVVIKGFALAHMIYDDPEVRAVGDLDVLVRPADRDRLVRFLDKNGYVFEPLPRPPWGFISAASYAPFVSGDATCNLDVHIHPDCFPAYRSLTTDAVFARAISIDADGLSFRAACADHAFLLCATNVAKDKFGLFAARKIADAMRLARHYDLDWPGLDRLASAGGYAGPYRVFLRLLHDLGMRAEGFDAPVADPPPRAAREYARMLAETLRFYPDEPGLLATLRRELLLSTELPVGAHNMWARIKGLVRRDDGVPDVPGLS